MTAAVFDLDTLVNNPKANATIYFPSSSPVNIPANLDGSGGQRWHAPIKGLVESDFQTDIQSLYSSVDPGQTAHYAQTGYNAATGFVGGANRVINNVQQTLQRWTGHSSPSFTIPITIVKYKPEIDILDIVRTLVAAPAGTYDGITLVAPYGYGWNGLDSTVGQSLGDLGKTAVEIEQEIKNKISQYTGNGQTAAQGAGISTLYNNINNTVYGTWTISYSDWFVATGLIITHVQATVSKETIKGTNEPLYAKLAVTFTTAWLPDARTIESWFLPKTTDFGATNRDR